MVRHVKPGEIVRHHSGSIYEIIGLGTCATNGPNEGKPEIIYRDPRGEIYTRLADEFYERVSSGNGEETRPRFEVTGRAPRVRADVVFMNVARWWAKRGTCDRAQVGAVAFNAEGHQLTEGYNGALAKLPHCQHHAYDRPEEDPDLIHTQGRFSCVRAVHAEINIVTKAAKRGAALDGATVYSTTYPCIHCFRTLISAGIVRMVYDRPYWEGGVLDPLVARLSEQSGVALDRYTEA